MPPAVAAAGIAAGGAITQAVIGSRGNNRAIGAQERATNAQLQLERERDAARNERYNRAYKSYEEEKRQYDQIRRQLLEHYGVRQPQPAAAPAPAPANVSAYPGGGGMPPPAGGMTLGDLMGSQQPSGPPGAPAGPQGPEGPAGPGGPVSDDAFDWRRYGVR